MAGAKAKRRLKPAATNSFFPNKEQAGSLRYLLIYPLTALNFASDFFTMAWYSWRLFTSSLPRFMARMASRVARAAAMVVV